ncbi:hypothetical protein BaRGS_00022150, partial [Batillaria attramentaria]
METKRRGCLGRTALGCSGHCPLLVALMCSALLVPALCEQLPACQIQPSTQRPLCDCSVEQESTVICGNRTPKLTRIPSALPEDITILDVNNNAITMIAKDDFIHLERVRTIFLQQNQIATIEDGAFANLHSLQLLVLYNNRLTQVPDTWFQHLPSITTIDLSRNDIQTIDKRAFLTVPASKNPDG